MTKESGADDLPPLAELRSLARRRVIFGGVAVNSGHSKCVDCQIRDFSAVGARIQISSAATLPDQLYLIAVRNAVAYEARVIWRRRDQVGLAFNRAIDLHGLTDPSLSYLVKIMSQRTGNVLSWR